jgi:predicted ATPase
VPLGRRRRDPVFLTRVVLKNYRSIAACDVKLGALTFLVGPNGSGKSNFLDALRLVTEALRSSLDHALRERGGIQEVRRRSSSRSTHFAIRVDFILPKGQRGHYAFEVGARPHGAYVILREQCHVGTASYRVEKGKLLQPPGDVSPPAADDRLYLVAASGLPPFRPVFDALSSMGFYNLNPDRIRALQPPDKGDLLARDGSNLTSVLERLEKAKGGHIKQRIEEYLSHIVPGIEGVDPKRLGNVETLEFRQRSASSKEPWRFPALNMSDGTLRTLGILIALFQSQAGHYIPLVGIEEPEVALHPAAAGLLRDSLRDGSRQTQVLVTSHSPDLLDDADIPEDAILAVVAHEGQTEIGPLDEPTRSVLRKRLYTAGELLRANQLSPDDTNVPRSARLQVFDSESDS